MSRQIVEEIMRQGDYNEIDIDEYNVLAADDFAAE